MEAPAFGGLRFALQRGPNSPDISVVDFVWCLTALDWNRNRSLDETAEKLMELNVKAREEGKRYALQTTRAAAAALQRRGGIGI